MLRIRDLTKGPRSLGSIAWTKKQNQDVSALEAELVSLREEIEPVDLFDLFRTAKVVSLHAPDIPETRGMIGRPELFNMPHGAVLINAARGRLIDTDALVEAAVRAFEKHAGTGADVGEASAAVTEVLRGDA